MSTQPAPVPPRAIVWRSLAVLALFVLVVACALVPQHGWDPAYGPVVPHDKFPADCSLCHMGSDWHTLRPDFRFDHAAKTGVALEGAHATAGCLLCHNDRGPAGQFAAVGCAGCHADVHRAQLGRNCGDCHDERTWYPREAIARHDRTRFPLVGAHAATACFRCHGGAQVGNFSGAPSECSACHQADRNRTTAPDHRALNYSQDCSRCHLPTDWRPARFDHPASFPLTNGHAGRSCNECHTTPNVFTGLSTSCNSCHDDDFAATVQPNHAAASFGTDCSTCHGTTTFHTANWSHPGAFALTNGHAGRTCTQCHTGQVYTGTSSDCSSCHLTAYQGTTNPNHVTAGYPTTCNTCHGTSTWHGGAAAHPATFPLSNAHSRPCSSCHTTPGVYTGLSPTCVSCHLTNYQGTTSPNHTTAGYNTDCAGCHGTVRWTGATATHPATFPLTNSHNRACTACHTGGVYSGLSTACSSCHLAAYQASTNPSHTAFQMSQQCQDCHRTTTWTSTTFVHHFPITSGNHRNIPCYDCHNNATNRSLFSCIDCHEHSNQSQMANKHHEVSNYSFNSTRCYQCHPQGRS